MKSIEAFDYEQFYQHGKAYVKAVYPFEVADYYINRTNLLEVKEKIPEFLSKTHFLRRRATIEDVDNLLEGGWLVALDLNSRLLNKKPGYSSHMVVIFSKKDGNYILHDPGLPPEPNRCVERERLIAAWSYSEPQNRGLLAVRKS